MAARENKRRAKFFARGWAARDRRRRNVASLSGSITSSFDSRRRDMPFQRWCRCRESSLALAGNAVARESTKSSRNTSSVRLELNTNGAWPRKTPVHAAMRAIGGWSRTKACRDRRNVQIVENIIRATRYGLRRCGALMYSPRSRPFDRTRIGQTLENFS